mgnify:CR=1 FL=1
MDLLFTGSWAESSIAYLYIEFRKCSNETLLVETNAKNEMISLLALIFLL